MTAPVAEFPIQPAKAWEIANDGYLKINSDTRRAALMEAAQRCAESSYGWLLGNNRWLVVGRLINPRVADPAEAFHSLVEAVQYGGFGPRIKMALDHLVGA